MKALRRLSLLGAIGLVGLLVQAAPAAGSQGPEAGSTRSTGVSATFFLFPEDGSLPQVEVALNDGTTTANPINGPTTTTRRTQVFVLVFNGTDFIEGCFQIQPSDFMISSDLSAGSLHVTITESTPTCEFEPFFQFPQEIDVTWTGVGPQSSSRSTEQSDCKGYRNEIIRSDLGNVATATASVTPILSSPAVAAEASLGSGDFQSHVQGTFPPLCQAGGGGKGAFGGVLPPGFYQLGSQGANAEFSNESGDSADILATTNTQSANPIVGQSTSTTESLVNVSLSGSVSGITCFFVDPASFSLSRDLTTATLHVTLTESTATCDSLPAQVPLPLTIEMTWTAFGPLTSSRDSRQSVCGNFRIDASSSLVSTYAAAEATLSGAVNESFASAPGDTASAMSSLDNASHIEGTPPPGCFGF